MCFDFEAFKESCDRYKKLLEEEEMVLQIMNNKTAFDETLRLVMDEEERQLERMKVEFNSKLTNNLNDFFSKRKDELSGLLNEFARIVELQAVEHAQKK